MSERSKDIPTIQTMLQYGGSFALHIGRAAMVADAINYPRLKAAFPELWQHYEEMTRRIEEQELHRQRK